MTKICPVCGNEYEAENKRKVYCSYECKKRAEVGARREAKRRKAETAKVKKRTASLREIAVQAINAGMSYGEYVRRNGL